MAKADNADVLYLSKWPTAQRFVVRASEFLNEVQDLTPGKDLEGWLNENYGPGNPYYEDFCSFIRQGLEEGQYHAHTYGEINCVVQIDQTAELKGMRGRQRAGWTAPGPDTHHYPEVRGGALVALFFLPAGRISYTAQPGER